MSGSGPGAPGQGSAPSPVSTKRNCSTVFAANLRAAAPGASRSTAGTMAEAFAAQALDPVSPGWNRNVISGGAAWRDS